MDTSEHEEDAPTLRLSTIEIEDLRGVVGDSNEPSRDLLRQADLIFGEDKESGRQVPFFGIEVLEDIAAGRQSEFEDKKGIAVRISFSQDRDDVELLAAVINVCKGPGSCCYGR